MGICANRVPNKLRGDAVNPFRAVQKIRACEDDAAAQIYLEWLISTAVAAERAACANYCEALMFEAEREAGPMAAGFLETAAKLMRERP